MDRNEIPDSVVDTIREGLRSRSPKTRKQAQKQIDQLTYNILLEAHMANPDKVPCPVSPEQKKAEAFDRRVAFDKKWDQSFEEWDKSFEKN
jgi:hypothetical protein